MVTARRPRVQALAEDASVTPIELFFDLVFVYALTQVTALLAADLTGLGVVKGMVVLTLVWWCWVGFSWLGNNVQADEGITRGAFFAVMAAVFVAALAIPGAFDDSGAGFDRGLVFALAYTAVRCVHLGLFAIAASAGSDGGLMRQLGRFGAIMAVSIALMVIGASVDQDARVWWWLGAIAVDFVGTQAIGAGGWRLRSARHFAERHGLIIIIALGESIVAIGAGLGADFSLNAPILIASCLGIALAAAMWWTYFDVTAIAAERQFASREGVERTAMARDAYSYIHLGMVAGIVLAALGMKKVLGYVSGDGGHSWTDTIHGVPPWALHGGLALYLLAITAMRWRIVRSFGRARSTAAVIAMATLPLAFHVPALVDLVIVTGIAAALVAFEVIQYAETRHRIRHVEHH